MTDPGEIYTAAFYAEHAAGRDEYRRVADALHELFGDLHTVVDVGCGPGFALHRLQELGHDVRGIEGSFHALDVSPISDQISIADITTLEAETFEKAALVMCTEVAEHLDAAYADKLVATLAALAETAIYFTAAPPGQGGLDHINEQPQEYWIEKFDKAGWVLDAERSAQLRARLFEVIQTQVWYPLNSMVFVRRGCTLAATPTVAATAPADIAVAMAVPLCGWDPARIASRERLKKQLGPPPAWVTPKLIVSDQWVHVSRWFRSAIDWGLDQSASHFLLMQDDARVPPGFWEHLHGVIAAKPNHVISLYTIHVGAKSMGNAGLKWIATMDLVPGVAWLMPMAVLRQMRRWEETALRPGYELRMPEDSRVGMFCAVHALPILQPIPSLVEHGAPDDNLPSNYGSDKLNSRRASLTWKQAPIPAHWNGPAIWCGRGFAETPGYVARNVREWDNDLMTQIENGSHPALRGAPAQGIVPFVEPVEPSAATSSGS
jgi:SAM-dependent methyltransferase